MAIKQRPDSPTNNFATLNPLYNGYGTGSFSNGNLYSGGDGTNWVDIIGTVSVSSLKWYWEVVPYDPYIFLGIISQDWVTGVDPHTRSNQISIYGANGQNLGNNAGTYFTYGGTDIISILVDLESTQRVIKYFKNGTTSPVATINIPTSYTSVTPLIMISGTTTAYTKFNFGQDPTFAGNKSPSTTYTDANGIGAFYYQPPTDALALCSANLPEMTPTVDDDVPKDYFKMAEWVGDGTTSRQITHNLGFDPDLVWIKNRDADRYGLIADSVRGKWDQTNGYRILVPSLTYGDDISNWSANYRLIDKSSTTFSVNGGLSNNESGKKFIAWCWKAGGAPSGSTSTTGSAKRINTSGTQDDTSCSALATAATNAGASNVITPTLMSINQAAGFSIVKYSGTGSAATVPHGLSSAPEMVITKSLLADSLTGWMTAHISLTNNYNLILDDRDPAWNPGSNGWVELGNANTFELKEGTDDINNVNKDSEDYIAYCWHSVEGFSKFGIYTANGLSDGPFVYCGFRPAFVMVKRTDVLQRWGIKDIARDSYNPSQHTLYAEDSVAEYSGNLHDVDFLSNGFKIRNSDGIFNTTNGTYVFMAFAEQPFNYANAR